jgi:iron only hydrogenase large subunit-like protein
MPCTAKKFEAQREEMTHKGISDIDLVLTSRELVKLINLCGIDVQQLQEEMADNPFNIRSSAGKLVSVSGGMAEAIVRTTHFLYSNKELPEYKITKLRGTKERRETNIQIGDLNLGVAVVSGLKNAKNILEEIRNGRKDLHYIEIMACPGGCINGGGQPFCSDEKVMKSRAKAVYDLDEKDGLKVAHKNPAIIRLYEKFLKEPLSVKANSLLHTRYSERDVLL